MWSTAMIKVVLSFDDGRSDQYDAYKILLKYDLKATFHIVTGFIDGTFSERSFGEKRIPLAIKQLVEMKENNMELSSHGDKHMMGKKDFLISKSKLAKWQLINDVVGFSVPKSSFSNDELNKFYDTNKEDLCYIRVGRSPKCFSFISKIDYVLYHLTKNQLFFNRFNRFNLLEKIDKKKVFSLVVKKDSRIKNILRFLRKNVNKNVSLVLMFHSIVEKPNDKWEYSIAEFEELCKYLKESGIKVLTLKELVEQEEMK